MVSLYTSKQIDFFKKIHSFQVFLVCSLSPLHITSIVPLSNFPSFEFVSRYNSSLMSSGVYNAMAGIWPNVFCSVLLYCLHELFHQLPNQSFYLHSYSIHVDQALLAAFLFCWNTKIPLSHKLNSCYWSDRCMCCVKVFTDLAVTPPANHLVSTAPTMAQPGQISVPWFSRCVSAKNYLLIWWQPPSGIFAHPNIARPSSSSRKISFLHDMSSDLLNWRECPPPQDRHNFYCSSLTVCSPVSIIVIYS